jgi:very-short-patch-repair endonuclease
VVEADGNTHTDPARDCNRDTWFLERGWSVLRFKDNEITDAIDEVLDIISMALENPQDTMDFLNENKPHRWCIGPH